MGPFSEREMRYLERWKTVRKNKSRYLLRHSVPISLVVSMLSQAWKIGFVFSSWSWTEFAIRSLCTSVIWYLLALFQFNATERRFHSLYQQEKAVDNK
jgi:hypothetical protein